MILSPPYSIGLATIVNATLHFPPVISLLPAHRKCLLILSKSAVSCLGALINVNKYVGIELSTKRTNSLYLLGLGVGLANQQVWIEPYQ